MLSEASALAVSSATELKAFESADSVSLRDATQQGARTLRTALRKSCQAIETNGDGSRGSPTDSKKQQDALRGFGIQLIRAWFRKGKNLDEVIEAALAVVGITVASQARAVRPAPCLVIQITNSTALVRMCSGPLSVGSI